MSKTPTGKSKPSSPTRKLTGDEKPVFLTVTKPGGKPVTKKSVGTRMATEREEMYGNISGVPRDPLGKKPKPPKGNDNERVNAEWDILTGYLRMSAADRDALANEQLRLINATEDDMVRASIIGKVSKSNFDAASALVKLMSYEGYNPLIIIKELSERAAKWNSAERHEQWVVTYNNVDFTITEAADLANDIQFLSILFLTRGNNLRKILTSLEKTVKTPLTIKIQTYGIKSDSDEDAARRKRNERVELTSKDVTLSRIVASYPQIALAIARKAAIVGKVETTCLNLKYRLLYKKVSTLPPILAHGLIPALLPKVEDPDTDDLKKFCYFFNVEQSMTLQTPSARRSLMNEPMVRVLESAEKFVNAAISGPLNNDDTRRKVLNHLGLQPTSDEELNEWVKAGSMLYVESASAGSYHMLQSRLSMEVANMMKEASVDRAARDEE